VDKRTRKPDTLFRFLLLPPSPRPAAEMEATTTSEPRAGARAKEGATNAAPPRNLGLCTTGAATGKAVRDTDGLAQPSIPLVADNMAAIFKTSLLFLSAGA